MGEEVGNFVPTVFRETAKIRRLWPGALSTELKKKHSLMQMVKFKLRVSFLVYSASYSVFTIIKSIRKAKKNPSTAILTRNLTYIICRSSHIHVRSNLR